MVMVEGQSYVTVVVDAPKNIVDASEALLATAVVCVVCGGELRDAELARYEDEVATEGDVLLLDVLCKLNVPASVVLEAIVVDTVVLVAIADKAEVVETGSKLNDGAATIL